MTSISTSDIVRLATLSGLSLADGEEEILRADVEKIISYVDKLDELDVEGVEPTYQVGNLANVNREDEVEQPAVSKEQLLELAPKVRQSQVEVPKVL